MKDLKNLLKDDAAFEQLFVQTMQKVGKEQDKERIRRIHEMNENDIYRLINGVKPTRRYIVRYTAAVCIACFVMVGGIQYNTYWQTIAIGDRYSLQISTDMSNMKASVSEEMLINLGSLFLNVENDEKLDDTIVELQKAYSQSADASSEYNYVRNYIAWNLAIGHLKNGDRKAAIPILNNIINDPDNEGKDIQKKAKKALDDINSVFSLW